MLQILNSRWEGEIGAPLFIFGPKVNDRPSLFQLGSETLVVHVVLIKESFFSPLARIHFLFLRALLALDVAAPAHLALARPGQHAALGVMATPTADGVTVLVLVALPCCRPCGVYAGLAEVGRVLDVQKLRGA